MRTLKTNLILKIREMLFGFSEIVHNSHRLLSSCARTMLWLCIATLLFANSSILIGGEEDLALADNEVPVFITIGQSNADAWGAPWNFDYDELNLYNDQRFPHRMGSVIKTFYDNGQDSLKIFYRAMVMNGDAAAADLTTGYGETGSLINKTWIKLNYQSDLANNKATMTSLGGSGTATDAAQYTRSMEAPLGYYWVNGNKTTHGKKLSLYIIKGAAGGSSIASWTGNGKNWVYFRDNLYKAAIEKLVAEGKKPRLVGIYWMQGEFNLGDASYDNKLTVLASQIRSELGFPNAKLFVGAISGSLWNANGNNATYLAQKRFCENSLNHAILIDNELKNRRFHGDMLTDDIIPPEGSSKPSTPLYTTAYASKKEVWATVGGVKIQQDLGSTSNRFAHYTAGSHVEIASEIFDLTGEANRWSTFKPIGAKFTNLRQALPTSDANVAPVTYTTTWPTPTSTVIEYSLDNGTTYGGTIPSTKGAYKIRAIAQYDRAFTDTIHETMVITQSNPGDQFVISGGSGSGASWADPRGNLQEAINVANTASPKGVVYIGSGDYNIAEGTLNVPTGVVVEGSYTVSADRLTATRDLNVNPEGLWDFKNKTVVKSTTHAIKFDADHFGTVDGITFESTNANAEIPFSGGTAKNCVFIKHCFGVNGSTVRNLIGCKITQGTKSGISNFGMTNKSGTGVVNIENCLFSNITGSLGVIFFANQTNTVNIKNTIVANNSSSAVYSAHGGAVGSYGANTTVNLEGCTIVKNKQTAVAGGGGVFTYSSGKMYVKNSIIWGNTSTEVASTQFKSAGTLTLANCAVQRQTNDIGRVTGNATNVVLTEDNMVSAAPDFAPEFENPNLTPGASATVANWQLKPTSYCVNTGANSSTETDILGKNRVWNNYVPDMGAYELQAPGIKTGVFIGATTSTYTGIEQKIFSYTVNNLPNGASYTPVMTYAPSPVIDANTYAVTIADFNKNWSFKPNNTNFTIEKAPLTSVQVVVSSIRKTENLTLKDVALTGSGIGLFAETVSGVISWKNPDSPITRLGIHKATYIFTPVQNYLPKEEETQFLVTEKDPLKITVDPSSTTVDWNGTVQTISYTTLPENTPCRITYTPELKETPGTYQYTIESIDPAYEGIMSGTFIINKRSIKAENVGELTVSPLSIGNSLSSLVVRGDVKSDLSENRFLSGRWQWDTPDVIPTESGDYHCTFTPNDNNYMPYQVTLPVTLTDIPSTRRYVTQAGGLPPRDGRTWETAYNASELQGAIEEPGVSDVWVGAGFYRPTKAVKMSSGSDVTSLMFHMKEGVNLYGGFQGSEIALEERQKGESPWTFVNATILDGDMNGNGAKDAGDAQHVVYFPAANIANVANADFNYTTETIVNGFTIQNGYSGYTSAGTGFDKAGGVQIVGKSTLSECIVRDNKGKWAAGGIRMGGTNAKLVSCLVTNNVAEAEQAGGILISSGSAIIEGCTISNNTSKLGGGGAYVDGVTTFKKCQFIKNIGESNDAAISGGGLFIKVPGVRLESCQILANKAGTGGAAQGGAINSTQNAGWTVSTVITNCLFANNESTANVAGVLLWNNKAEVINSTFVNNKGLSANPTGSALWVTGAGSLIHNNIFWNNKIGTGTEINLGGSLLNNAINGAGAGNIAIDAGSANALVKFVTPSTTQGVAGYVETANWSLAPGSVCIGAGTPSGAPSIDILGENRSNPPSIGAYEYPTGTMIAGGTPNASAEKLYVTITGAGDKNGSSWIHALPGGALSDTVLKESNDLGSLKEVYVGAGTYVSKTTGSGFTVPAGVEVYGGYSTTPTEGEIANPKVNKTLLTLLPTLAATRVVEMKAGPSATDTTILDGFSITGGVDVTSGGAGVRMDNYGHINQCNVYNNSLTGGYSYNGQAISNGPIVGAGVLMIGANTLLTHSKITGNTTGTSDGGGVLNNGGKIENCIISNNIAGRSGGGVHLWGGSISNSTITGNTAKANEGGGGIFNEGVAGTIKNCTISKNVSTVMGGGISSYIATNIDNCTITRNTATSNAGGIYASSGVGITAINSIISGNKGTQGGGLWLSNNSSLTNCVISNNEVSDLGAAIAFREASMTHNIINCTITKNKNTRTNDTNTVGAIIDCNGTVNLKNTIIWGNDKGGASKEMTRGPTRTTTNCAFGDKSLTDATHTAPITPDLGTDNTHVKFVNPSTTQGFAGYDESNDWKLAPGSSCIGGGTSTGAPILDINGSVRIDPPSVGAFEYQYAEVESIVRLTPERGETTGTEPFTFAVTLKALNNLGLPVKVKLAYSDEHGLTENFPYCVTQPSTEVEVPAGSNRLIVTIPVTAGDRQTLFTVKGGGLLDKHSHASPDLSATVEIARDPNMPILVDGYRMIENNTHLNWFASQVKQGGMYTALKGKINADFEISDVSQLPIGNLTDANSFTGELIANSKQNGERYKVTINSNAYRQFIGGASTTAIVGDFDLHINCEVETDDGSLNNGFFAWDYSGLWKNMNLTINGKIKATGNASIAGLRQTGSGAKISGVLISLTENTLIEGSNGWGASLFMDDVKAGSSACVIENCGAILESGAIIQCFNGNAAAIATTGTPIIKNTFIQLKGNSQINNSEGLFCSKTGLNNESNNNFLILDHNNATTRNLAAGNSRYANCYTIEAGSKKIVLPQNAFALSAPTYGFASTTVLGCSSNVHFSNFPSRGGYAILSNLAVNYDYGTVIFDLKLSPAHPTTIKIPYHIVSSPLTVTNNSYTINTLPNWNAIADLVDSGNTMNGLTVRINANLALDNTFKQMSKTRDYPFMGLLVTNINAVTTKPYTLTFTKNQSNAYGGLLGYLVDSGRVENANVIVNEDVTISGTSGYAGAVVGYTGGSIKNSYATINGKMSASGVSGATLSGAGGMSGYISGPSALVSGSYVNLGTRATIENATSTNINYRTLGGFVGAVRGDARVENSVLTLSPTTTFIGSGNDIENGLFAGRLNDGGRTNIHNSYITKENDATYALTRSIGSGSDVTVHTLRELNYGRVVMFFNTPYNLFPIEPTDWRISPSVLAFPGFKVDGNNYLVADNVEATFTGSIAFAHTNYPNFELPYTIKVYPEVVKNSPVRYVSVSGGATFKDGYTFESAAPFSQLNTLLADAHVSEIRLASGYYTLTSTINVSRAGIKMTGGWISNDTRNKDAFSTSFERGTLTANMINVSGANVILENLKLTGRWIPVTGRGLHNTGVNLTIRNMVFTGLWSTENNGPALQSDANPVTVVNSQFTYNRLQNGSNYLNGGAVFVAASSSFDNCLFAHNEFSNSGGIGSWGILFFKAENVANKVINCTFAFNKSGNDAAVHQEGLVANTVFFGNTTALTKTGTYTNCASDKAEDTLPLVTGADFKGNGAGTAGCVDNPALNMQLTDNSLLINKGLNADVETSTDLLGATRIQNYVVDIGAYESASWGVDPADINISLGENVTFIGDSKGGGVLSNPYTLGDTIIVKSNVTTVNKVFANWSSTGGVFNTYSNTQDPTMFIVSGNTDASITATEKDYIIKYVSFNGSGDGLTFETPMGISKFENTGANELRFLAGTYSMTSRLEIWQDNLRVIGGWKSATDRTGATIIERDPTLATGTRLAHIETAGCYFENMILDGKNIETTETGPLLFISKEAVIDSCIFRNGQTNGKRTGAVHANNIKLTVKHSQFINNIQNSNYDWANGGAFFAPGGNSGNFTFTNCLFKDNACLRTGGSGAYGVVAFENVTPNSFTNCTFVNNRGKDVGTIFKPGTIRNCVFFGNTPVAVGNFTMISSYSAIDHSDGNSATNINLTGKSLAEIFVSGDDLTPCENSPIINRGSNNFAVGTTDLAQNARIQKGVIDMGAYESAFKGKATFVITAGTTFTGSDIDLRKFVTSSPLDIMSVVSATKEAHTYTNNVSDAGVYDISMIPEKSDYWLTTNPSTGTFTVYQKALSADSVRVSAIPGADPSTTPVALTVEFHANGTWTSTNSYTAEYFEIVSGTDSKLNGAPVTFGNFRVLITLVGGNYTGHANTTFTQINPITVNENSFVWTPSEFNHAAQDGLVITGMKNGNPYELIKGNDYTVRYTLNSDPTVTEAKDVGVYNAHVIIPAVVDSGFSNAFSITPVTLAEGDYTIGKLNQFAGTFSGLDIKLLNDKESWPCEAGKHYTALYEKEGVTYPAPTSIGTYRVIITFTGNYTGTAEAILQLHDNSIRYLANTASGNGMGYDWDNAIATDQVSTINAKFAEASILTIYLKQGTYYHERKSSGTALNPGKANATVIGGFPDTSIGKNLARNWRKYPTFIKKPTGQTNPSWLLFAEQASITFDGLYVDANSIETNGGAGTGANASNLVLKNMIISGTKKGARIVSNNVTISNVTFKDNISTELAPALELKGMNATLDSCLFVNNSSTGSNVDGTIYIESEGTITISRCRIENNQVTKRGGGLFIGAITTKALTVNILNTLLANNQSEGKGSALFANANAVVNMINCTVVNNLSTHSEYNNPIGLNLATINLKNSTVWGNLGNEITAKEEITTKTYCNTQDNTNTGNNFSIDPKFVTPSTGAGVANYKADANWSLQAESMNINRGNNLDAQTLSVDLAGRPRFEQKYIDIGAYETTAKGVYTAAISTEIPDVDYHALPYPATPITSTSGAGNINNITFIDGGAVYFQNKGGLPYGPSLTPPTNAGVYTAQANITEPQYWSMLLPATFTIRKINQTFTAEVSKLTGLYISEEVSFSTTLTSPLNSSQPFVLTINKTDSTEFTTSITKVFPAKDVYSCVISKMGDINFNDADTTQYSIEVQYDDLPITVIRGTASHRSYIPGRTITFTAADPEENKFFDYWTSSPATFTLTDTRLKVTTSAISGVFTDAITVTATFADLESEVRYGTVNGSGMKNGYNWNHAIALEQIQDSLNENSVKTLKLANGTYVGLGASGVSKGAAGSAFILPGGKSLIGGFPHFQNSATDTSTILTKGSQTHCRILLMASGTQTDMTTLENVTIRGGNTTAVGASLSTAGGAGAGILTADSAFILNCVITGNTAVGGYDFSLTGKGGGGAGIVADGSHVTIKNSMISNNIANNVTGAGVVLISGTLYNCQFINNTITNTSSRRFAGGLHILGTSAVDSCLFDGNIAVLYGGAVYDEGGATITRSSFINNKTTGLPPDLNLGGGALYMKHVNSKVLNSYFKGNSAAQRAAAHSGGGAIGVFTAGGHIENCVIEGNEAGFASGVGFFATGTMDSCIIRDNKTPWNNPSWQSGALFFNSSNSTIKNTIISENKTMSVGRGAGIGSYNTGTNNQFINCTIINNENRNIDAGTQTETQFVFKSCIIFKGSTMGIDLTKMSLENSAVMSENTTSDVPGRSITKTMNSFFIDPINNAQFGPRFLKKGSTDIAQDSDTLDPTYTLGEGSVLINRGINPTP